MTQFEDFAVGDNISFERVINRSDFDVFESISGDNNPLHHDQYYAKKSGFKAPIAPVHLVAAPLSAIAGTIFPGESSLYLGHKLQALKPVFYGDTICYSARIVSINTTYKILGIRVLGLRETDVVLCCDMDIQARSEEWEGTASQTIFQAELNKTALVTGATGDIGKAVAKALSALGWNLILHYRTNKDAAQELADECTNNANTVSLIAGDFESADGCAGILVALQEADNFSLVVHSACPVIDASFYALQAVQFQALEKICSAALPRFLRHQAGTVVYIGSTAVSTSPDGWEDYIAAKNAATGLMNGLHNHYSKWGIRYLTLAPSYVVGSFSQEYRPENTAALMPGQVAETAIELVGQTALQGNYIELSTQGTRVGAYGFQPPRPPAPMVVASQQATAETVSDVHPNTGGDTLVPKINMIVCNTLGLAPTTPLAGLGVGTITGWDSLGHIQVMLELERELGLSFSTEEVSDTLLYDSLVALCVAKLGH